MLKRSCLIASLLLFLAVIHPAQAFKAETFVTIVSSVRGLENWSNPKQTPLDLPRFQYQESTHSALPVTWLLRFDAVTDATISAFFGNLIGIDKNQSLGAFLEITPSLASAASINTNHPFLSSYSTEDRKRLLNTYMKTFFDRFGFYPQSVSAWDLDSYSLEYLQTKYSVITAMNHDDQYTSPYFPDKNNSLIPASSAKNRINLAMVRWAQKDLFNYESKDSSSYPLRLIDSYGQKTFNEFTYLNIGLENDYNLTDYKKEIRNAYGILKTDKDKYNLHPISLAKFGDWFKGRFPESTPAFFYQATDPANVNPGHVYWYQSPFYRIGISSYGGHSEIVDFRVYNREIYEDYFTTPNQNLTLSREVPSIIDSVKFPGTALSFFADLENFDIIHKRNIDNWEVSFKYKDQVLTFQPDKIIFTGLKAPDLLDNNVHVSLGENKTVWQMTPYTPYEKTTQPTWLLWLVIALLLLSIFRKIKKNSKTPLYLIIGFSISLITGLTLFRNGLLYPFGLGLWGPNGHDAIFHLSLIEKFSQNPFGFSHPQIAGERIGNYHFIFDFVSGLTVRLLGISALDFYFRLFPILAGLLLIGLLDKLMKSWAYSYRERLASFFFIFLTGSFGFVPKILTHQDILTGESAFWANQSVSLFLNPPFVLSLIIFLFFLIIYPRQFEDRGSATQSLIILSLFGGLLAQTKIYAFILLLGALLISKKLKLFFGVLVFGLLISIPFTSFGKPFPFVFSPLWFTRSLFASFDRFYWLQLVTAWQAYEASGNLLKLTLVNLFALTSFWIGNLGVRFLGLISIARSKPGSDSEKLVRWTIVFGLLIPVFFVQAVNPWNTIQFMYYSLFFLGLFTSKYLVSLHLPTLVKSSLIVLILTLSLITTVGTLRDYISYFSSSRVSYTELLALDKLRSQPRGIVLSPLFSQEARLIATPKPLYAYVSTAYISAFSGQPEYLADTINLDITGFDYQQRAKSIQRFYNTTDKQWSIGFLKANGIQYVYETPLQKMKLPPHDLLLEKIFDSGEINIYKFN